MNNTLLVCSKSTRDLLPEYDRARIVTEAPDISLLAEIDSEEDVVAVGGGAVIDTAKILAKNPITCYPTTGAGASSTSWAVYWDKHRKHSIKRHRPKTVEIIENYLKTVPYQVWADTKFDIIAHCIDSLLSKNITNHSAIQATDAMSLLTGYPTNILIVGAGILAGGAIEITGTNLLHALSYPITGFYGISHGAALGFLISKLKPITQITTNHLFEQDDIKDLKNIIDIEKVIEEAFTYDKINNVYFNLNKEKIKKLLINE